MSILPQELIENVVAKDIQQIIKMNPTTQEATNDKGGGDAQPVTIRGFSVNNPIINGIPYSTRNTTIPMMQDIERVEIISGATGFLYGGGRVGGAVNYVTKKPTLENLKTVSVGSYGGDSYFGSIDLSGQFDKNDIFGYRLNALYQDGELPSNISAKQKAVSLVLDYKPMDNFSMDLKYSYKNDQTPFRPFFFSPDTRSIPNDIAAPKWLKHQVISEKIENSLKWNIDDIFTLRTNLFYEESKYKSGTSSIYVRNGIAHIGMASNEGWIYQTGWRKSKNHGINTYLDSQFNTGDIQHILTMGYMVNESKAYTQSDGMYYYRQTTAIPLKDLVNFPRPTTGWSQDWSGNPFVSFAEQPFKINSKQQYENILIGDDIRFNDNWSALIGFNYATTANWSAWNNISYDDSALTPTLSLIYKPTEHLTTYATYIESLENGTVVGSTYLNENEILAPYMSTQYELGTKYNLKDRALLTASLFRIAKANSYEIPTTPKPTLTQNGEQVHQGIELGITGKVTNDLTLVAGVTVMDLELTKATNATLEGKKPTNVASKMAKLYAEYKIPAIEGLYFSAGAYYTGEKYADSANTDIVPAYTVFDAGVRYSTQFTTYPTTLNLNFQNLTNKSYWTDTYMLGDPRAVTFSVKTQF